MSSLLVSSFVAAAQEPAGQSDAADPLGKVSQRVEELERAQRAQRQSSELEAEKSAESAQAKVQVTAGEKGFSIKTPDGAFALKLKGAVQIDGRAFPSDQALPLTDGFFLRRIRPTLDVTFLDLIDLRVMPDFGNSTVVLIDAYVDVRAFPWLKVRVGKFKPPVGLERLQSVNWVHFIENASPSALVPSADLGIQLHGELASGAVSYAIGAFGGGIDGAVSEVDPNENKEIAGRIFSHPFRFFRIKLLENFGIGMSATFGRQTGTATSSQLPSFRSPGQQTFFTYVPVATANGNRTRLSPQGYLYLGPVGLLAEYVSSSQSVTRLGQTTRVDNAAWNTTLSVVVTGEAASHDGVSPKRSFSFKDGSVGAFEIVARYHVLRVDQDVFNASLANAATSAQRATSFGVGVNWFLNRNARVSLNFEHTWFVGGAVPEPLVRTENRAEENAVLARLQIAF